MNTVALLLLTLLNVFPPSPGRRCIEARRDQIVTAALAAEAERGVPAGLLLTVGFLESWLGCHPGENGNWGAPLDRRHRHRAGTPASAASALAMGYRRCGTWLGALGSFRCGLCRCSRLRGYTPEGAWRRTMQIYRIAGIEIPSGHVVDTAIADR